LEGRWAGLTLDAFLDKALDFSYITRDDPESLLQEELAHKWLFRKRQLVSRTMQTLYGIHIQAVSDSLKIETEASETFKLMFPWQVEKPWSPEDLADVMQFFKKS